MSGKPMLTSHGFRTLVLGVIVLGAGEGANALMTGTTAQGGEYVSGGVGEEEAQALRSERSRYSFALLTAAKGSGAYLSGARILVTNAHSKQMVLDHTLDGPQLMVALPPGRYEVQAIYREQDHAVEQNQKRVVIIAKGRAHPTVFFYFDSADTLRVKD